MSGNAASGGAIALGVLIGVLSIAFPPAGAGFFYYASAVLVSASLVSGGALGLAFQPKSNSPQASKAKDLDFASAGVGFNVPVIFGEQKVVGNFMNWQAETFHAKKIKAPGGKGGSSAGAQVIGYDYYLTFEYGICMGPVDEIGQVWSVPGEIMTRGLTPAQLVFTDDDPIELTLNGKNEGGLTRVYRGSNTQTRLEAGDPYFSNGMNYRNTCFAVFLDFKINRSVAQVKTYQFLIRRRPRCTRDDTTNVDEIQTRGSSNTSHPAYYQANPAAIVYEILTNKIWGRGLSSAIIDETSFAAASEYFLAKNLGMSFTLDSADKLVSILDSIRMHLKTVIVFDGEIVKLRVLMDPEQTHANILTLTSDEITDLAVMRPLWPSTFNEIRVEFNNVNRNYKPDSIIIPSLANFIVTGRMNPMQIQFNGFSDWNIARRQGYRILREQSYPFMTASFSMNRFKSQLEIGDVFRLIWQEYGSDFVTAYFMAMGLEAPDTDSDEIKVSAVEDIWLSPVTGQETTVAIPDAGAWDVLSDMLPADTDLFNSPFQTNGEITPVAAFEVPAIITGGDAALIFILGQLPRLDILDMQVYWVKNGKTNYALLGAQDQFAITGTTSTSIRRVTVIDRLPSFVDFALSNPTLDESNMLGIANLVTAVGDDMETLIESDTSYMIIGEEIIQVGSIVKLGTNSYRAKNVVRGCFGTRVDFHDASSTFYFFETFGTGFDAKLLTKKVKNQIVKFRAWPESSAGVTQVGSDFFISHRGTNDQKYLAVGIRPFPPSFISVDVVGDNFEFLVRPRFFDRGAGTGPFFGAFDADADVTDGVIQDLISGLDGMTFRYIAYLADGTEYHHGTAIIDEFNPDDFNDPLAGSVKLLIPQIFRTFPVHSTIEIDFTIERVRIFSVVKKQTSVDAMDYNR